MLTPELAEQRTLRSPEIAPQSPAVRRRRWGTVLSVLTAIIIMALALVYSGLAIVVGDRLSRPDRRALVGTPTTYGLPFEAVEFNSLEDGIPLRGWWMPATDSTRAVILVHGRNSTRTGHDGELLRQAQGLVRAGFNVFTFDLRAHGESGGVRYSLGPWERRDVRAAIAHVRDRGIPGGSIALLGHSMGGAVSLLTAADSMDVGAVIADSTFARLSDLLEPELPRASGLPAFFSPAILFFGQTLYGVDITQAAPEAVIPLIRPRPMLFIHSESDTYVPAEHSRRLWRLSGQAPDMLWLVSGPKHDRVFLANPNEYLTRVVGMLNRALP